MFQVRDWLDSSTLRTLKVRNRVLGKSVKIFFKSNPLKLSHGKGTYMYDEDGQAYLDGINNVAHVGHCHPDVVAAGTRQMAALSTNNRFLHDEMVVFAAKIAKKMPPGLDIVYFVNSGSEANDLALRLAHAHTKAKGIVTLDHAYHGHLISLMEISPYKYTTAVDGYNPGDHVQVAGCPDTYRGKFTSENYSRRLAGRLYARQIKQLCGKIRQNGHRVAAYIAETFQSCGGQIIPPRNYLKEVYKIIRGEGGVVIADEVQCGYGRIGTHFAAFNQQGVSPDIATFAKAIGNGHPVGIVLTTREIADSFTKTGMSYFNTYGGNPVSCAILNAVLDVIHKEELQLKALETGAYIVKHAKKMQSRFDIIGAVRGQGLFVGIELVKDRRTREPATAAADWIINYLRTKHRILLSVDGPYENVIKMKPPMQFGIEHAKIVLSALEDAFSELYTPVLIAPIPVAEEVELPVVVDIVEEEEEPIEIPVAYVKPQVTTKYKFKSINEIISKPLPKVKAH